MGVGGTTVPKLVAGSPAPPVRVWQGRKTRSSRPPIAASSLALIANEPANGTPHAAQVIAPLITSTLQSFIGSWSP